MWRRQQRGVGREGECRFVRSLDPFCCFGVKRRLVNQSCRDTKIKLMKEKEGLACDIDIEIQAQVGDSLVIAYK